MIKLSDIRKAISKVISSKNPSFKVYVEDVSNPVRPCVFLKNISYNTLSVGEHRQRKKATFDLIYYPTNTMSSSNNEIQDALEQLNDSFDNAGFKVLVVSDRKITILNSQTEIVENLGHYIFDIEFITQYTELPEYELMQNLELNIKE